MKKQIGRLCLLGILAFGLSACQAFFSTSLTPWAARTSLAIPATISTVQALDYASQALATNDPVLAASLTPILLTKAKAASSADPELYTQLANAMVTTVVLSSNVGTAFNQALVVLTAGIPEDEAGAQAAITAAVAAFNTVNYSPTDREALQHLVDQPPQSVSPADVEAAAVGLVFQALKDTNQLDLTNPEAIDLETLETDPSFALAMDLLTLIPEGADTPLGGILGMLGDFGN